MSLFGISDGQQRQTFSRTSGRPCCDGKKSKEATEVLRTTYQQEYYEKEAGNEPAKNRLHLIAPPRDPVAKFVGTTTYGGDFTQYEAPRRALMRPTNATENENMPFQGQSTYSSNYDPKTSVYKRVKPEHSLAPSAGAFEGESTHNLDFKHWGVPQKRAAMVQASIAAVAGPFEGASLYTDTFKRYPYAKREPQIKATDSDDAYPKGPIDANTIYRSAYTGMAVEVPQRHRPVDSSVLDAGWYEGKPTTEYNKQFFEKAGAPAKPMDAMHGQRPFPDGEFDGSTNYNADFKKRDAGDRARSLRPRGLEQEKLPFTGASTYTDAFLNRDAPHNERFKAKNSYEPNLAPFEGVSTNKADYANYETPKYVQHGPQRGTNIPLLSSAPFDGRSTYSGDFQRLQGKPAGLLRPERAALSAGAFDSTSTYRLDFVQKEKDQIPIKPASVCSSCANGGVERP